MQQFTQQQMEDRFTALPKAIQEVLESQETGKALRRIGNHHNLHIDQLATLNDITVFVILGLIPRESYLPTLSEELGVSEEAAEAILAEVNTEILEPMRASLSAPKENVAREEKDEEMTMHLPTRDEILREIEHPLPIPEREETRPKKEVSLPGAPQKQEYTGAEKQETTHQSIIEKKITQETTLREAHSEETKSNTAPSPSPETPPDPYREPVE